MTENNRSPEEILNHLLDELRSTEPVRILTAITELDKINFSSPAIMGQLEKLALQDDPEIRKAALLVLNNSTHRYIRTRITKISFSNRKILLDELEILQKQGLLNQTQTDVIKLRYNFDITPLPAKPTPIDQTQEKPAPAKPIVLTPKPKPVIPLLISEPAPVASLIQPISTEAPVLERVVQSTPVESRPAMPATTQRRTLTQALLSETSIKIALYLGSFFVIASAIILATLVASARLPILIGGTTIFGVGALAVNKRLPQPSFALFIVFSFLLPITANVTVNQLGFKEPGLSIYWTIIALAMAAIWAYATHVYSSRLFSVTAFMALDVSVLRFAGIFQEKAQPELFVVMLSFAASAGLVGVRILKKWKNNNFSLPLFILAQVQQPSLLIVSLTFATFRLYNTGSTSAWWLVAALTWVLAFVFYILSEAIFPLFIFPWAAATALIPIAWLVSQAD